MSHESDINFAPIDMLWTIERSDLWVMFLTKLLFYYHIIISARRGVLGGRENLTCFFANTFKNVNVIAIIGWHGGWDHFQPKGEKIESDHKWNLQHINYYLYYGVGSRKLRAIPIIIKWDCDDPRLYEYLLDQLCGVLARL